MLNRVNRRVNAINPAALVISLETQFFFYMIIFISPLRQKHITQ